MGDENKMTNQQREFLDGIQINDWCIALHYPVTKYFTEFKKNM